jgi:FkbM family methyltransferase
MKNSLIRLRSYLKESSFVIHNSLDWRSCIRLLNSAALFHLNNARGNVKDVTSTILVRLRIGADRKVQLALRPGAGDIFVLFEVLMDQCYDILHTVLVPDEVNVIVDCGANIGITSLFLASRYPNARIYSIEPNPENFELLKRNTAGEPNIVAIHGAIVGVPRTSVRLTTHKAAWENFITEDDEGLEVPAVTIEQICTDYRLSRVDLLKVDIEGAEKEMFENSSFLRRVGFVIVELHGDYDLATFSHDIAPWSFVAEHPKDGSALKMIVARPMTTN